MDSTISKNSWTLKEIANWTTPDSCVTIPSVQRGLVWKPKQVELLWDSILRQFPIGAFTLSASSGDKGRFNLLDGQQRWNAIASGYGIFRDNENKVRSILWFDLNPEIIWSDKSASKKTTRKYFIRATTIAHPWGFCADDECSRLDTQQKREALAKFGFSERNTYNKPLSLNETYPIFSGMPIPLCWLLEAAEDSISPDDFKENVRKRATSDYRLKNEIDYERVGSFFPIFKKVIDFKVPTIYLSEDVIEREDSGQHLSDDGYKTDIEVLFERIGTGGTQISKNELIYSAIKAYWPEVVKAENDRLAEMYMPPVSLVMLAIRLALSPSESGEFVPIQSVKKVREIASHKESLDHKNYKKILELYVLPEDGTKESRLSRILDKVNYWLLYDNTPAVLRTGIARNSPDIYLLLMYLAAQNLESNESEIEIKLYRAIAFYLHWMVDKNSRGDAVNQILKCLTSKTGSSLYLAVTSALARALHSDKAVPLWSVEDFINIFGKNGTVGRGKDWRTWGDGRKSAPLWEIWKVVAENKEMLMYAQREYMSQKFQMYDPAKMDMWEEYNRPWDFDHIIPQNRIHKYKARKHTYTDYCENWKNKIGNMAAIPFEVNRAKGDGDNWDEYRYQDNENGINHRDLLLMDESLDLFPEYFEKNFTNDEEKSYKFAQVTFNRLCRIYRRVYDLLEPVDINRSDFDAIGLNDISGRRKFFEQINDAIGASSYHVYGEEGDRKEYPISRESDWVAEWASTGVVVNEKYYVSYCIGIDENLNASDWEMGIRRLPGRPNIDKNVSINQRLIDDLNERHPGFEFKKDTGDWYYIYASGDISKLNSDEIIEGLTILKDFAQNL